MIWVVHMRNPCDLNLGIEMSREKRKYAPMPGSDACEEHEKCTMHDAEQ